MKSGPLVLVHNSSVLIDPIRKILENDFSDIDVLNIIDESLLRELIASSNVTVAMRKRICRYVISAAEMGARAVLMTCSSLSETVDLAKELVDIPVFKMDEPMIEEAVAKASRIGVLGTLKSVVGPNTRLIERKAGQLRKQIVVESRVCDEAFSALLQKDFKRHDEMVLEAAKELSGRVEVLVLAQGSMARLTGAIRENTGKQVLDCLFSGIDGAVRGMKLAAVQLL
jgi:aspartate/glutamate racemase